MMAIASFSVSSCCSRAFLRSRTAMSKVSSEVFFQALPRERDKQMRQPYQTHVMVPARPRACLVVRHSEITLSLLQELFHTPATPSDQCHRLQRLLFRSVGHVVLQLRVGSQRAPDQQPYGGACFTVPHRPHTHASKLEHQWPGSSLAQLQGLPCLRRQALCYLPDGANPIPPCTTRRTTKTV